MDQVNEKTSCTINTAYADEKGAPVIPTSGTYRIDDLVTNTAILGPTSLPSLAASVDIPITIAQNAMVNAALDRETHILTTTWTYGIGKGGNDEYRFEVTALKEVT